MAEKLNLGDLKIKDFQDKEKMNADATDAGKKALEEFQGKIGTLKEDPTKVLSNFSADFSAKKTKQDSFTGMILNLTENYFEPQIGNILAPNNPVVAKQAAILFGRSFVEQGLSTLQKPKQIKNINFTPVKRDNRGFMKCEIKGEKGKILATYLVPFTPQFFKKLEAEKETIKETAIEKRKLEQIQVLDQLIGDKVINKIKKIETDLGSDVTGLRLEESDGKKLKYIFTDKSQKEKKDLPFTVVIDKSDPTNIKFRIEKTGTDKNTKWCNIDEDLEKTVDSFDAYINPAKCGQQMIEEFLDEHREIRLFKIRLDDKGKDYLTDNKKKMLELFENMEITVTKKLRANVPQN